MNFATGWIPDAYEIARCHDCFGVDVVANVLGRRYTTGKDAKLPWEIEQEKLGKVLPSWNQSSVGSCVGFGSARCFQDSLLLEMHQDGRDYWPGELAPEVSYGGGRVEIGGGRINGDGSLGVWSAEFLKKYGVLIRKDWGGGMKDLRTYREDNCREWGRRGVPDDLEPECKKHGLGDFAVIRSMDDALAAWEEGYIGTYCGMEGYQTRRGEHGICRRSGSWAHCQYYRGVVWLRGNQPVLLVQNSWGDYLGSSNNRVQLESGREIVLPEGCYCVTADDANRQFKSNDSHVYRNVTEWEVTRPSWQIRWHLNFQGQADLAA